MANPKGDKTTYEYNALGSLVKTTDALNHFWTFQYGDTQNLTRMIDARQKETTYEIHQKLNRVESVTLPMNRKTTFTYDEVDNVKTVTNPLDQVTENVYDDLNRVEKTTFRPKLGEVSFGIRELRYTYTDAGDVTDVEERFENRTLGPLSRFVSMKYDSRHRVTEEKRVNPLENNVARVVSYNYDKSDRVTKVTDATGRAVEYLFDAAGRLEKVKENSATQATYNYFANGLIEKATYANGSGVEYGYDGANRVETVKHLGANGATIQQYGYGFDKNGNRVSENITRNGQTRRLGTFEYDTVNRLKSVTFGPKRTEYEYDEVGNRVVERDLQANKVRNFTHDDANRLTGVTENGVGIASYVWDAAGNVTQATESGVTWFYSYDLRQQMTTVRKQATTGPPTFAGEYEYDYAKRRIGRNGVWNVYDGDDLLNEFSSAPSTQNSALNSYTYGNELIRSSRDGNSFADAQGSVTLTDNGTQKFSEYGAFGEVITTDHEESHIGYTGQFFDNETGLMPLGNGERYYSPLLGRFLQEDSYVGMPDSPWSLNRYSYTFNNPFKYTDPSGNEGVISDSLKKNSVSEDRGWWTNFFTSFVTGYAYDVYNVASLGMLGTLDVAAQDIQNGKSVNLASAWSRGGSGATLPEIGKNYWTYTKGVGRGVVKAVEGIGHLAYGLATDPANTAHAMKEGITDQILGIADAVQNPQGVIKAIAADPDKAIGNIGEFAGEIAAFEVGGAAVGAVAGRVASPALEALGRTKAFQAVAGSGFGKVVTSAAKTIGTAHRGLVEWEGRQFAKIPGSNFVKRVAQTVSESRAGLAEWEGKQWSKLGPKQKLRVEPDEFSFSEEAVTRNGSSAKPDLEFSGREPQPFVDDLSHITGKTAKARRKAIEAAIAEDLPNLKLTGSRLPEYSPFVRTGVASKVYRRTHLGKNVFSSRRDLVDTIVHEELHLRWWFKKQRFNEHHPRNLPFAEDKFHRIVDRYMRLWEKKRGASFIPE